MCRKRGLKVNAGKSWVMELNGEEGLECEVHVDRNHLEHVLEFKYLGCGLDESGTDGTKCSRKVASGRLVAGAIRSLVNVRDLQLECARVLHETLHVPVLLHDSETMLWKEISRIRAVQMDNLRGNTQIRELCGVTKGLDERIDEGMFLWFRYVERIGMENGDGRGKHTLGSRQRYAPQRGERSSSDCYYCYMRTYSHHSGVCTHQHQERREEGRKKRSRHRGRNFLPQPGQLMLS